jgi:hypothetical protein
MRWIKLAEEMNFDPSTDQVFWRDGVLKLDNDNIWRILMDDCRNAGPFALVIPDTAAAYYTGDNENDNVQQEKSWQRLRLFTQQIPGGPTVLVPCHPMKNAPPEALFPRGGTTALAEPVDDPSNTSSFKTISNVSVFDENVKDAAFVVAIWRA